MNVLAVLDTMYNWRALTSGRTQAPRFFEINPRNRSGARLYKLVGNNKLLVTNCCKEIGNSSGSHGKPDKEWLSDNLKFLSTWFDVLLVCGNVATRTYLQTGLEFPRVMYILHPAARNWTKDSIARIAEEIGE